MSTPLIASAPAPAATSFRALVVPREHGSWSLALEPVALGLLVAPSLPGGWLALAVVAAFFTRRPLKLALTLPASDPRRAAAWRWCAVFAGLALAALLAPALASSASGDEASVFSRAAPGAYLAALWPLLLALPFAGAFLWFDLRNEMREAEAELAGSTAFALVPAAFATLAGWAAAPALALAAVMLARSISTVLAVRTFLRERKGRPAGRVAAWTTALVALAALGALASRDLTPLAAVALGLLFVGRTAALLQFARPTWTARGIGMTEAVIGVVFLVTLALAYRGF